jgi:hemerythrin
MALIWKNEYSVGVPEMDLQHRKLVDLLNQLEEAMGKGKGKEIIGKILNELVRYTQTHFTNEEFLMLSHKFPELSAHKLEHMKLTQRVLQFKADFDAGKVTLTIPILNFLEDWLVNHIQGVDKVYGKLIGGKLT